MADQGSRLAIEGRLQTTSWGDPRRYKTEVVAEVMDFLDRREPVDVVGGYSAKERTVDNDN